MDTDDRSINSLIDEFETGWKPTQTLSVISEYLARGGEAHCHRLLVAMALSDFEFRLQAAQELRVEDYLHQFVALSENRQTVFELIQTEYVYRRDHGATIKDYCQRFPQYGEDLQAYLKKLPLIPGYTLLQALGRGAMGVVYKAKHHKLKRVVALKMVRAGEHASPRDLARFRTEAESVASLQDPHVVQIFEMGEHNQVPYLALEFVDGGTLGEKINRQPQPHREGANMVYKLALAIHKAHTNGVVHRDLKPVNILLMKDGTPKISDFGLAKSLGLDAGLTQTGELLGTPHYMAPEQTTEKPAGIGPAMDVYGLGAILYAMLTGEPPFKGVTIMDVLNAVRSDNPIPPIKHVPTIPLDLNTICLKCLEKEPARRYASAQELAADLKRFLDGEPVRARRPKMAERAWRAYAGWWRLKPKRMTFVHILSPVVLLVLIIGVTWWRDRAESERQMLAKNEDTRRRAAERLQESDHLQKEEKYEEALARVRQVEIMMGEAEEQGLREDLGLDKRLNDLLMIERLREIRLQQAGLKGENLDTFGADSAYAKAFHAFGIDVDHLSAQEAASQIRLRSIRGQLIGALDDWSMVRQDLEKRKHLLDISAVADDDEWRKGLRECIARQDLAAIQKYASTVDVASQPPPTLEMLGLALGLFGDVPGAVASFRKAQLRHPKDLLINHHLARHLQKLDPPRHLEAAGFFRVVQALYPDSPAVHLNLGIALYNDDQHANAIAACREATRRKPDYGQAHEQIGLAFGGLRQWAKAVEAYQEATHHAPKRSSGYYTLGYAHAKLREFEKAAEAFRNALNIDPNDRDARDNLATAHFNRGNEFKRQVVVGVPGIDNLLNKAVDAYREAVDVKSEYHEAHVNLGLTLLALKRFPDAEEAIQRGLDLLGPSDLRRPQCERWLAECKRRFKAQK